MVWEGPRHGSVGFWKVKVVQKATELRRLLADVEANGIDCLAEAAQPLGDVFVVAPDREQSATSHSLTLHHPLRPVALRG